MTMKWLCVLLSVLVCAAAAGCGMAPGKDRAARREWYAMNTYMTLAAYGPQGKDAAEAAEKRIHEIEKKFSVTDWSSAIAGLNRDGAAELDGEMKEVLSFSLAMAKETGGALDPAIYPLVRAWGWTTEERRVPSDEEIASLLPLADWRKIEIKGQEARLAPGMAVDLGAVVKGYAGREAGRLLRERGIHSAILSLGGNIEAVGSRPDGSPWRVGLQDPAGADHVGILEVRDAAVVTSGSYERYFMDHQGRRWHHILDPATGKSAESGLLSVTVTGRDGMVCDALSTALFVMGARRAEAFWRAHPDFDMILLTEDGRILLTEGADRNFIVNASHQHMPKEVFHL